MSRLIGKVALVTGAAGVLGAAQAKALAAEGAQVVVADLSEAGAAAVTQEILAAGSDAMALPLDVTDEDQWSAAIAGIVAAYGRLNVLVNNAEINATGARIEDRAAAEWDRIMEVNAKSVFLGTKLAIPALRAAGGGSIINISSVAALGCGATMEAAYAASKAAVWAFTRVTAAQHGAENIRCNSIHPGPIDSDMLRGYYSTDALKAKRLAGVPLGRFGRPEEVGAAAVFLASDESGYMTGGQLAVDGGSLVN